MLLQFLKTAKHRAGTLVRQWQLRERQYQPILLDERALDAIRRHDYEALFANGWAEPGERKCTDRLELLVTELRAIAPEARTVLDLGCANGFIDHVLAAHGYSVSGVDNDAHNRVFDHAPRPALEIARDVARRFDLTCEFYDSDAQGFLESTDRTWDASLCLSLVHHFFVGYGFSGENRSGEEGVVRLLRLLAGRTRRVLFFESMPKVMAEHGWGDDVIRDKLASATDWNVREIGRSSERGFRERRLYALTPPA